MAQTTQDASFGPVLLVATSSSLPAMIMTYVYKLNIS